MKKSNIYILLLIFLMTACRPADTIIEVPAGPEVKIIIEDDLGYLNRELPAIDRAKDLLNRMSLLLNNSIFTK